MSYPWLKQLRVSHSSRKTLKSCARKFELYKIFVYPGRQESFLGEVGKALHAGFQDYLTHGDQEKAIWEMMIKYPINFTNVKETHKRERSLEACYATLMELMTSHKIKHYELVQIRKTNGEVVPAVEVPFEIRFPGVYLDAVNRRIPISYIGFIDLVIWDPVELQYRIVDIKSHRRRQDDLSAIYQWDEQCLPYALVIQNATGQLINSFSVTYLSAYTDIEDPRVVPYTYEKSAQDVNDWLNGFMVDIKKLQEFYRLGWFPRDGANVESCMSWGSKCQFFDSLCGSRNKDAIYYTIHEDNKEPEDYPFEPWITMDLETRIEKEKVA